MSLAVNLPGLNMKNPLMPASGCFGFGEDYAKWFDLNELGAIATKAITVEKRTGNATPRTVETPHGMLNAIGLQNPGLAVILQKKLPFLRQYDIPILANVAGSTEEDYETVVKALSESGLCDAIEVNISCPNVKEGGIAFGQDANKIEELTRRLKQVSRVPLYMKLSPNVTSIVDCAKAAVAGGADGLSLINTLVGMRFSPTTGTPILANGVGGLSGGAILPVALRMVYEVRNSVNVPIIGMGGIDKSADVLEFLQAGADAVAVGTAHFKQPTICVDIANELEETITGSGWAWNKRQEVGV
ncbi:dihydroorotate dehydrogenase [Bacillus fonticola]|uniref:dihydroorotate dehydrogenase n=1 Tax=Bacillus fonticola TaxID=2728853 RepID=UPI0014738D54|nr:dihydroorotate dehydrogenase [Bacillus fonticola]